MGWSNYTNTANTALTTAYKFMYSLIAAYNERAIEASLSTLPQVEHLGTINKNFCRYFDDKLDLLIVKFVNTSSNIPDELQLWTLESIYANLNETRLDSRADSYKLYPLFYRKWYEQIIHVLNALTLVRKNPVHVNAHSCFSFILEDTFSSATAAMDNAYSYSLERAADEMYWQTAYARNNFTNIKSGDNPDSWRAGCDLSEVKVRIASEASLNFDCKLYFYADDDKEAWPLATFDSGTLGYVKGYNVISQPAVASETDITIGDYALKVSYPPASTGDYEVNGWKENYNKRFALLDFAIPGGFEFLTNS